MTNIAVIPARGGSKRLPRKNIRLFYGKPIIAYSIEAALSSPHIDRVIVSTDDQEVADIAKSYGAEVPFFRPAELADDYADTASVIKHAITELVRQGSDIGFVCCIYATAPFIQEQYLSQGYQTLISQQNKLYAFSAGKFSYPVQRAFTLDNSGLHLTLLNKDAIAMRSQDLPSVYHDAGQFYWARAETFVDNVQALISEKSIPILLPDRLVQDIDSVEDWQQAEYMYQVMQLNKS